MGKETPNYYIILEVDNKATIDQIKASYKRLALRYHPDKTLSNDDTLFKQILEAYQILSDVDNRRKYDIHLQDENDKSITFLEISGFVVDVVILHGNQNHKKLIIECTAPDSSKRICTLEGFYPIHTGDIITGFIDKKSYAFIRPPLVVISTNKASILDTLNSFHIKGVTPKVWENIYNRVNNLCNDNPPEVVNMFGRWSHLYFQYQTIELAIPVNIRTLITESAWKTFLSKWNTQYAMRSLYLLGLSKKEIMNSKLDYMVLYKQCLTNPWSVPCLSLEKCDMIDQRLNRTPTTEQRICGKILRQIYDRTWNNIHSYQILSDYIKMFPEIPKYQKILEKDYQMKIEENRIYYRPIYDMEVFVADYIVKLMNAKSPPLIDPIYEMTTLTDEQKEAIELALNTNISFYTGGPGVGKSTIIKEIVRNNDLNDVHYVLCSFTGKAVARIKEITNKPAFTIDMLMSKGLINEVDHIIIDEISMTALELMYRLFYRLSTEKHLPVLLWLEMKVNFLRLGLDIHLKK